MRLILRLMVARGLYHAQWWHKANIALDGGTRLILRRKAYNALDGDASLISCSMVARGLYCT